MKTVLLAMQSTGPKSCTAKVDIGGRVQDFSFWSVQSGDLEILQTDSHFSEIFRWNDALAVRLSRLSWDSIQGKTLSLPMELGEFLSAEQVKAIAESRPRRLPVESLGKP